MTPKAKPFEPIAENACLDFVEDPTLAGDTDDGHRGHHDKPRLGEKCGCRH